MLVYWQLLEKNHISRGNDVFKDAPRGQHWISNVKTRHSRKVCTFETHCCLRWVFFIHHSHERYVYVIRHNIYYSREGSDFYTSIAWPKIVKFLLRPLIFVIWWNLFSYTTISGSMLIIHNIHNIMVYKIEKSI